MNKNIASAIPLMMLLLLTTFTSVAYAEESSKTVTSDEVIECTDDCVDDTFFALKLSAGYFRYESPLNFKDNVELNVLPTWTFYYKDDFFIESTKIGYNLYKDESTFIDFVGLHNFDGLYYHADESKTDAVFSVNPFLPVEEPTHNAHLSYLAGPEIKHIIGSNVIDFGMYKDVSKTHHGEQANFSFQHRVLDYKIKLVFEFGAVYKSNQLLEYYYGSGLVGDNINYYTQIDAAYPLLDGLFLVANYKFERLSSKIISSQFTDKKDLQSGYIGINWVTYW